MFKTISCQRSSQHVVRSARLVPRVVAHAATMAATARKATDEDKLALINKVRCFASELQRMIFESRHTRTQCLGQCISTRCGFKRPSNTRPTDQLFALGNTRLHQQLLDIVFLNPYSRAHLRCSRCSSCAVRHQCVQCSPSVFLGEHCTLAGKTVNVHYAHSGAA